jgi:hypothetical protein
LAHNEAKTLGVEIREIAPSTSANPALAAGARTSAKKAEPLEGNDVAIGLRGPFRNIVSLLADLPRHDVLLEIHDVELTSVNSTNKIPVLNATVHSTIYRLVAMPLMEEAHAGTLR